MVVEFHETMADAILREKRIKKWRRTWKLELIERHNRQWRDLYEELGESARPLFMPGQALGPRLRGDDEQGGVPHANFSQRGTRDPRLISVAIDACLRTRV